MCYLHLRILQKLRFITNFKQNYMYINTITSINNCGGGLHIMVKSSPRMQIRVRSPVGTDLSH